jgi:hypothetical protein
MKKALGFAVVFAGIAGLATCGGPKTSQEDIATVRSALTGPAPGDPAPCTAWGASIIANTGGVILNSQSLVDSYASSRGGYGGTM